MVLVAVRIALIVCLAVLGTAFAEEQGKPQGKIAPYYPTPIPVAMDMLEAADLQPDELVVDLGSGDGRLVILAARNFGARAVGVELDSALVESSRRQIGEMELGDKASIVQQDLFTYDFSDADVITVYLLPRALGMLRPLLEKNAKEGVRVISHDFPIDGWEPDERVASEDVNDIDGLPHTIYVYRR